MDRLFLDANVIFSAAYNPRRRLGILWKLPDVELVTSEHAAAEAIRNLRLKYPNRVAAATAMLDECGLVRSMPPSMRRFRDLFTERFDDPSGGNSMPGRFLVDRRRRLRWIFWTCH